MHKFSFIGLGPVGLCTAVCFANKGYHVTASEIDKPKANKIRNGEPPFYEANLKDLLQKTIRNKNLEIVTNNELATLQSDVVFITVGTPSKPDGSIDLRFIINASKEIGKALRKKKDTCLVVVKSTVTPGTTENIVKPIIEKNGNKECGKGFLLCANPEFLREGSAIEDTLNPDYIIIGGHDKESAAILENLYKEFYEKKLPPIIKTNVQTAELIKYSNNAFLATKVSLTNTIANICEKIPGTDIKRITEAIGNDRRIGPHYLNAGLGWGGSCFPKDLRALIAFAKNLNCEPTVLLATYRTNEDQIKFTIQKVKKELKTLEGEKIAILGLAFKPNTDDIREAQSIELIKQLQKQGAAITAYDPIAMPNAKKILKERMNYACSAIECLKNADCAVLVTEWEEFKKLKPEDFTKNMRKPILIDGRRIYSPGKFSKKLRYIAVGLGETQTTTLTADRKTR
jgi:UDPglucose 6-dehydrogenase